MSVFDAVDIFFDLGENGGLKRDKHVIQIISIMMKADIVAKLVAHSF